MNKAQKIIQIIITIALITLILFILHRTFLLFKEEKKLKRQVDESAQKIENLKIENKNLSDQINYMSNNQNLEKELRAKFNYKKPEEKMMIIQGQ